MRTGNRSVLQAVSFPDRREAAVGAKVARRRVALQRCDTFVSRAMNWLYDHLRFVPRHTPLILCDRRMLREEFPELDVWVLDNEQVSRRLWRRIAREHLYPVDK